MRQVFGQEHRARRGVTHFTLFELSVYCVSFRAARRSEAGCASKVSVCLTTDFLSRDSSPIPGANGILTVVKVFFFLMCELMSMSDREPRYGLSGLITLRVTVLYSG